MSGQRDPELFCTGDSAEIREAVNIAYLQVQEPMRPLDKLVRLMLLAILARMEELEDWIAHNEGID